MGGSDGTRAFSEIDVSSGLHAREETHTLSNDIRAQSVVIGAILVFAIAVLLLGIVQATLIPNANEDIEAQHSQEVRGQMQDLRNNVERSASTGQDTSQGIKVGVDYPARVLFVNPGPASGSLRTEGTQNSDVKISVDNVEAVDEETKDYWDGSGPKEFSSGAIVYKPNYNVYQNPPDSIAVENSLVYSKFDGATLLASDQRIISGKEISLTALDGDVSTSQVPQYTVSTRAVSPATTSVPVTNNGDPIRITIPTRLSEETLIQDVFRHQIDDNGGAPGPGDESCADIDSSGGASNRYVADCSFDDSPGALPEGFNTFTLVLESGNTYTLEMAKVGLGNQVTKTDPTYLVDARGRGADVALNGRQPIEFEVRDQFNNPTDGETVDVKIASGDPGELIYQGTTEGSEVTDVQVDPDGTVDGLYYEAPSSTDTSPRTITIQAKLSSGSYPPNPPDLDEQAVELNLQVINGSRVNRSQPLFNPATGVIVTDVELIGNDGPESKCGSRRNKVICEVRVTFENTKSSALVASKGRYTFFNDDTQSSAGVDAYPRVEIFESPSESVTYPIQDTFSSATSDGIEFSSSSPTTLSFKFQDASGNPPESDVEVGDWFVVEFVIDGTSQTYFVVVDN